MKRFDADETTGTTQEAQQTTGQPYVGRPIQRVEDAVILTGRGRYADDLGVKPGILRVAIFRSSHTCAELDLIDFVAALKAPGVRAVPTGTDLPAWSKPSAVGVKAPVKQWALTADRVRYVGGPIAVVAAESHALAEDAPDLVRADYRMLPPVVSIEAAIVDAALQLHSGLGSNVASDRHFCYGDPEAVFTTVPYRVSLTVHYPRNTCMLVECGVVIAKHLPGNEGYQVISNFMGPFSLHTVMVMAPQVSANHLCHIIPHDSRGNFGVKQAVFPYVVLMCLTLRKAGAPVKWVEDRFEHLSAATSATACLSTIKAAVEAGGRIIALDYDQLEDCGGYLRAPEPATSHRTYGVLTGAYATPNLRVRNRVVPTNKTPTDLVRGLGGPQVYFVFERLVQRISTELNLDPLDVHRRNFVPSNAFPYRVTVGVLLDSGNYQLAMSRAFETGAYDELKRRQDIARVEGRLYGIGFTVIAEPSVSNMGYITAATPAEARRKAGPRNGAAASTTTNVDLLGGVVVTIVSTPAGQGHMTVCVQVVVDTLGTDPAEAIVNVEFDTHRGAWSVAAGNCSSRLAGAVAGTVHPAATRVCGKLARIVTSRLDCDPAELIFAEGRITCRDAPETVAVFTRAVNSAPHWSP